MKGMLLVLLDPKTTELDVALDHALARHRLDEDADTWPRFYWDYWHLTSVPFGRAAEKTRNICPDAKCHGSACIVRDLPNGYVPSAVITPDGLWNDLREFGWRLMDDPCDTNNSALLQWQQRVMSLYSMFSDYICVEVLYHC